MILKTNLKFWRQARDLSQRDLARLIETGYSDVSVFIYPAVVVAGSLKTKEEKAEEEFVAIVLLFSLVGKMDYLMG